MSLDDWLIQPESRDQWVAVPGVPSPGGVALGVFVQCGNELARLKAATGARSLEARFSPALERVASRLAYEVAAPVAPVQLIRSRLGPAEFPASLSYVCPSGQRNSPTWNSVFRGLRGPLIQGAGYAALGDFVGVLAFDLWLAAQDRHDGNSVLTMADDQGRLARWMAIDYSQSAIWSPAWRLGRYHEPVHTFLDPLLHWLWHNGTDRFQAAVERIAALPDSTVRQIVGEVPEWYLAQSEREHLVQGLVERKSRLRETASRWLSQCLRPAGQLRCSGGWLSFESATSEMPPPPPPEAQSTIPPPGPSRSAPDKGADSHG